MDGVIVQNLIQNASHWFAAVPSLHGAYPVLLLLLSLKERNRLVVILLSVYAVAMWVTTVVLNQHYIVDLLAGAVVAVIAWWFARSGLPFVRKKFGKDEPDQLLVKSAAGN
jgi:membrane-associated phospholipid phosphatase